MRHTKMSTMRKEFKKSTASKATIFNQLDLWLNLLSHLSQIGLLIVAIIGYFYTVIPLYQKSVLDESIAKKEIELSSIQKQLDENYILLRKNLVGSFAFRALTGCTGLPKRALDIESPNLESELLIHLSNQLQTNAVTCLQDNLKKSKNLDALRKNDYELLIVKTLNVGADIETLRAKALKEFQDILDYHQKSGKVEALMKITHEYMGASREMLEKLARIEWDKAKT